MTTWIGAAIVTAAVAVTLAVGVPIATAAPSKPTIPKADSQSAIDFSARRYQRRYHRHDYRSYGRPQPHYYARPYYYRPYPYSVPAPFTFGFGFGPGWW
jgi:hypothetical protein